MPLYIAVNLLKCVMENSKGISGRVSKTSFDAYMQALKQFILPSKVFFDVYNAQNSCSFCCSSPKNPTP